MILEHETIWDDNHTQLHFARVESHNQLVPAHWHNHLEIICLLEGSMTVCINDSVYQLNPGDIQITNPKDIHYTHSTAKSSYYLLQIPSFHLERMGADWQLLHFQEYIPFSMMETSLSHSLIHSFHELKKLDDEQENGYQLLFLSCIYELLHKLYTRATTRLSSQKYDRTNRDFLRIEQSMHYVHKNYQHPICLEEVASSLSITPEHFCRLFKKYTGQTFLTYVGQIRMLHFYQGLLSTNESITYLLDVNGISNYKSFMREFKKAYGDTPNKIRMLHRGQSRNS